YVERAIRLAENHQERLELRRHIIENNGLTTLFTGDPRPMGNIFLAKLVEWADANNLTLNLVSPTAEIPPTKAKRTVKKAPAEKKVKKTTTTRRTVKK
ncbi:adhesin, partial [Ursidibacter sp. B-7004-1]